MCNNHNNEPKKTRKGATLQHGKQAHENDHRTWSRRSFLQSASWFGVGSAFAMGGLNLQTFAANAQLNQLLAATQDRILVIINLFGGNDGLNMVVPSPNNPSYQTYYDLRPNIRINPTLDPQYGVDLSGSTGNMFALDPQFNMPYCMHHLQDMWNTGKMATIHSVAYPTQNYSHFRSTEIWQTASNQNEIWSTGMAGRYLEYNFPVYADTPPEYPVGVSVGGSGYTFLAKNGMMGLGVSGPDELNRVIETGELYATANLPACNFGEELLFLNQTANFATRYAKTLQDAYNKSNTATSAQYPVGDYRLSDELAMTARLIKGGLKTKIYSLSGLDGFDNHANQRYNHPELLGVLASSVKAFYDDLGALGANVLTITISEFGRTVSENGSFGTDHGQAAPMFVFGGNVIGGLKGTFGELSTYQGGDQNYTTDFRTIYSTILQNWFCLPTNIADAIMGHPTAIFPNLLNGCPPDTGISETAVLLGHNPSGIAPNTTLIKYSILVKGLVKLYIQNKAGQNLTTLVNATQEPNSYTIPFIPAAYNLPPGEYIYKLENQGKIYSRIFKIK